MAIYQLNDRKPVIPASCYIAEEAVIIGDVVLGERVNIWFGAVLRGDNEPIVIGDDSNIQENCVLHTDPGAPYFGTIVSESVLLPEATAERGKRGYLEWLAQSEYARADW